MENLRRRRRVTEEEEEEKEKRGEREKSERRAKWRREGRGWMRGKGVARRMRNLVAPPIVAGGKGSGGRWLRVMEMPLSKTPILSVHCRFL